MTSHSDLKFQERRELTTLYLYNNNIGVKGSALLSKIKNLNPRYCRHHFFELFDHSFYTFVFVDTLKSATKAQNIGIRLYGLHGSVINNYG